MSDADRSAAEDRYRNDLGCGRRDASLGARAQFPFDDSSAPSEALRQEISQRVSHFVKDIAGQRGNDVGLAATRAIEEYLQIARDHRDMYYVELFEGILDAGTGPVEAPEPSE